MKKFLAFIFSFLLIILFFSSCSINITSPFNFAPFSKVRKIQKQYNIEPDSTLVINTEKSDFTIEGINKKIFNFDGEISATHREFIFDVDFDIAKRENKIYIESTVYNSVFHNIDIAAKIQVPHNTNIDAYLQKGELKIGSLRGNIDIKSDDIYLHCSDISGNITINTKRGTVKVTILEWAPKDTFKIINLNGDIYFHAPEEAKLDIQFLGPEENINQKFKFEKGETKVILKTEKGTIKVDKI